MDTSRPAGIGGIGSRPRRTFDGISIWMWAREKHLRGEIAERLAVGRLGRDDQIRAAQVLFRPGKRPEVRLNGEISGRQVVEGRSAPRSSEDETTEVPAGSDVVGFEAAGDEAEAGHITALVVASEIHLTFLGAADTDPIIGELDGAAHYITAAERLLGDPSLPDEPLYEAFADAAHTAAEKIARGELRRLPDDRPFKKHGQVSARYHEWARLGNTEMHFPKLLDSTFDRQRMAKYERSEFSLTPAQAAGCMETLHAMHRHASWRPREAISFPAQDRSDLFPKH